MKLIHDLDYCNSVLAGAPRAVDGWAVTFGTARRGLRRVPDNSSLYQM